MSNPTWDETEEIEQSTPTWEETEELSWEDTEEVSEEPTFGDKAKAAATGALQGLTLGFSDEIWAGAQAGLKEVYEAFGGEESDFFQAYSKAVEENRDELKKIAKKSPGAYLAGEIASVLVPGLGLAKAAKAGSKAAGALARNKMKTATALGAAEGAGRGEGLEGKAAGAAIGAALPTAVKYAGPIAGTAIGGATGGLGGAAAGLGTSLLARHALKKGKDILGRGALKKKAEQKIKDSVTKQQKVSDAEKMDEWIKLDKKLAKQKKQQNVAAEKKKSKEAKAAKKKKQKAIEAQDKRKKQLKKQGVKELERRATEAKKVYDDAEKNLDRAWLEQIERGVKDERALRKLREADEKSARKFARQADLDLLKKLKKDKPKTESTKVVSETREVPARLNEKKLELLQADEPLTQISPRLQQQLKRKYGEKIKKPATLESLDAWLKK